MHVQLGAFAGTLRKCRRLPRRFGNKFGACLFIRINYIYFILFVGQGTREVAETLLDEANPSGTTEAG